MTCANPACGHSEADHYPTRSGTGGACTLRRRSRADSSVFLWCPCLDFVPPTPSREPLMAQLEAVLRTRR